MTTLKVTITAEIALPEGAVEQAKATLAASKALESITAELRAIGATNVSESLNYKSSAGRKPKKPAPFVVGAEAA